LLAESGALVDPAVDDDLAFHRLGGLGTNVADDIRGGGAVVPEQWDQLADRDPFVQRIDHRTGDDDVPLAIDGLAADDRREVTAVGGGDRARLEHQVFLGWDSRPGRRGEYLLEPGHPCGVCGGAHGFLVILVIRYRRPVARASGTHGPRRRLVLVRVERQPTVAAVALLLDATVEVLSDDRPHLGAGTPVVLGGADADPFVQVGWHPQGHRAVRICVHRHIINAYNR
jgi:hypothetical protein